MSDIDQYHRAHTKELVNFLFDKGFLHDDLSRESIQGLEDYLACIFQSQCELAVRASTLPKKCRETAVRQKPANKEEKGASKQAEG